MHLRICKKPKDCEDCFNIYCNSLYVIYCVENVNYLVFNMFEKKKVLILIMQVYLYNIK